ncbi:MAG: c-type cytochrome biogenesis protein CcmI [Salinisphaera sp.]|jgi:cytochrome c-type biogenesis protein CcmH|nr:c-type cytochrome biogenesis protein CcmI [Salinisphaera sp.]
MIVFLIFAALLVAASLLFVLVPLWRGDQSTADKRREANITIYHQRHQEIEREVGAGRLSRREAEEEKDELGARLLTDIDQAPSLMPSPQRKTRRPWLATVLIVALFLVGGVGGYWKLGDWRAVEDAGEPNAQTVISELQERVNQYPRDRKARMLLAEAQTSTGQFAAAANNLHALNAASPKPRPQLIAAEADATLQATNDLQGKARDLFAQALKLDPKNRQALWFLGLAAAEQGDNSKAVGYWDRLLKQNLPAEVRDMVKSRRNELTGHKPKL